jgi:hypothetical protein
MTADDLLDAVRSDQKTELSRLGSSKSLYADTRGEMDEEPVLTAIADHLGAATEVFESWADSEDGDAADVFADAADAIGEAYDTVVSELGEHEQDEMPPIAAYLDGLEDTDGRLGGYVGWVLATEKKVGQAVGFFVGQAAPQTASTFRGVRETFEDALDTGSAAATAAAEDIDRVEEAAIGAVAAAYEAYFDTLEELGVNPKPVC